MDRDLKLHDFMEFPNLGLWFAMVPPYQWSGAPKYQRSRVMNVLLRIGFYFGLLNLIYLNFGLVIYLYIGTTKDTMIEDHAADNLQTFLEISENSATMGLSILGLCKMWILYRQKSQISALLEEFEKYFPSKKSSDYGLYRTEHFAHQSRLLMKRTTVFFVFAYLYYNLLPIVILIYVVFFSDEEFQYRFQSNTWYPWLNEHNRKSALHYIVVYLCQASSSTSGASFIMSGDYLLCFFTTQMRMHFEFLANALETLDASSPKANIRLKYLLAYHNRLLIFSKKINKIFNISFLVNFITSTLAISFMGLTVVLSTGVYALKYTIGLFVFLVFTLFICFNGNKFTESSNKLMPAAFYNNWYEGNPAYKKMILILIIRSVEPNYLRAYKFNTVSMETYMAILEVSYKLFTFFKAMG